MARRPKRSALALAAIAALVAFCQVTTVRHRCAGGVVVVGAAATPESAETDLEAAESRDHQRAALLNLPKFGDRLAPRNRPPTIEEVAPSAVGAASAGPGKARQARGHGVYGAGGRGGPGDIKRSDVMVVSSRSAKGSVAEQELLTEEEEEEEEVAVEEEQAVEEDREVVSDGGGAQAENHVVEEEAEEGGLRVAASAVGGDFRGQVRRVPVRNELELVGVVEEGAERGPHRGGAPGGNASSAQAHRLEMSTEFFVVPSTAASAASRSTIVPRPPPGGVILAARRPLPPSAPLPPGSGGRASAPQPPTVVATAEYGAGGGAGGGALRKEPWVVPVLVLASLSMLMMAAFEVFVLCKAWRTSPSRRHLFLGQMLLLGLFACSGLAAVLTVNPTVLSCATMRFGAGVAFALVFASLLVKCVFLISLNGGVYLPAPYQGLLLLFAVLIQVAVGGQWLLTSPPAVDSVAVASGGGPGIGSTPGGTAISSRYHLLLTASDLATMNPPLQGGPGTTTIIPLCHTPFSELLLSLVYIVFLIAFVAVLAIKSRGIRDNYREATYIGLAIGGIIPIWLGWTLCGLAVADRHRDACLAFGLVATSSTVFLVMFMPKGRQLAAMGKEGLYVEDREERFSSLSRAGSGYSPSFFHFKPIKYGVMGPSPTLGQPNGGGGGAAAALVAGTTTTSKHQAVATLGGDRVALVTAPPSYTPRMYHYFPAHMTHPFCYYPSLAPQQARYPGLFMRPDETNLYTTLEQTMSSNPNVYFQRGGGVHPGMMY
ncbi:uncharacterized protein LOC131215143 [Anopheles bellator]|uniref:uncharacterized protein LOC131215143 n=1 Tax=Anopheles bellator TaxID=139047 RepID=UPI002647A091|nr:uncharacterized protein LOC131215143 [Anopheles bellator]